MNVIGARDKVEDMELELSIFLVEQHQTMSRQSHLWGWMGTFQHDLRLWFQTLLGGICAESKGLAI